MYQHLHYHEEVNSKLELLGFGNIFKILERKAVKWVQCINSVPGLLLNSQNSWAAVNHGWNVTMNTFFFSLDFDVKRKCFLLGILPNSVTLYSKRFKLWIRYRNGEKDRRWKGSSSLLRLDFDTFPGIAVDCTDLLFSLRMAGLLWFFIFFSLSGQEKEWSS